MSTDPINHPQHYLTHRSGIECIQITEHMSFCLGNAIKYIWRADSKGDAINDLAKAAWYIDREIQRRKALADIENARLIGVIADSLEKDLVTKSASSPTEKIGNALAYAQAGDARRQYEMGNMAYSGEGMPQDREQAIEWWTLAAAQGHAGAQIALDVCASAQKADEIAASIANIRLQAIDGDREAQILLAQSYEHGRHGLAVDGYMATLWRSRANERRTAEVDIVTVSDPLADMRARAEAGDVNAQRTLGDAYAHGMEVAQDRAESDRWYALANAARTTEDAQ